MENLIINIINTTLFSFLVILNINLCFCFGNFFIRKIIPSNSDKEFYNKKDLIIEIIFGFIIICNLLSLINFFFKINYIIFIILIIFSLFSFIQYRSIIFDKKKFKILLIYFFAILCLSKISMISFFDSDTGYYHIPVVKIYNDYNTIFGLANLFPQYGFNNLNFYYSAMITANPFLERFFAVPTVFFFFIISIYLFYCRKDYKNNFIFLILLGGHFYFNTKFLSSIAPDFYVNCLSLIIFSEIYIKTIIKKKDISDKSLIFILLLLIAILTIKLSSIFLSSLITLYLFTFYKKKFLSKKFIKLYFLSSILLIIFFTKNIIYSGSPFFPTGFGAVNLLWSMPSEISENFLNVIKSFARNSESIPEKVLANYDWIYIWLKKTDKIFILSLTVSLLIYISNIIVNLNQVIFRNKKLNLLICIYLLSIFFWFVNAPDVRFSLMQNIFLFLLVINLNQIFKKRIDTLISKLSMPALFVVFIYAFLYLNFINIYLNYQKLEFNHGWRTINNYKFDLKKHIKINGLNLYFVEGYCWFEKSLCSSEIQYLNYKSYKTKVKRLNKNYMIYLEK